MQLIIPSAEWYDRNRERCLIAVKRKHCNCRRLRFVTNRAQPNAHTEDIPALDQLCVYMTPMCQQALSLDQKLLEEGPPFPGQLIGLY